MFTGGGGVPEYGQCRTKGGEDVILVVIYAKIVNKICKLETNVGRKTRFQVA